MTRRFIQLYLNLDRLVEHVPVIEETNILSGKSLPVSDNARHDEVSAQYSSVPIAASPAPEDGPGRVAEVSTASREAAPVDPTEASLWDQGMNLIPSKDDPDVTVDQDNLVRAVAFMDKIFSQYEGSQNCVVCNSMKDLSDSGELDLDRLKYNFEAAMQFEKEMAVKNHMPPPDPSIQPRLGWASIEKVDFVLKKRENWPAIRLQEFRRDEKALRVGPRRPPLSTSLHLSALSKASLPVTEEPGENS